jgi:high affinity sulfate transporter 1
VPLKAPGPLAGYRRAWLGPDVVAGLSAGAIVIPQAMAYAGIAGLPAQVGLYTCLVPALCYVVLGGSRALSFTTTSTIAVLAASTLAGAGFAGGPDARDLATLVLLTGVFLAAARVLRLAGLVENVSDALLTGLKFGVGLTVLVGQVPKLLGIPADQGGGTNFFAGLAYAATRLGHAHAATAAVGVGGLAALLLLKRVAPRFPGPLLVVVASIAVSYAAHLSRHGVDLIAAVPRGLPAPVVPAFDRMPQLVPGALAIALMAFLETVSVARTIRQRGEPVIGNDRELLACGVATVAGAFFRAMPLAGGFSQSAVNRAAGAKSQLSQVVTVGLAVLTAFFLGPVLSRMPQATLAALVIAAVLGLVSVREMAALARFSRTEFGVAAGTAVVALAAGLLVAVAVGIGLTIALVLHELNAVTTTELGVRPDGVVVPDGPPVDGLMIVRIDAPLYTANVRTAVKRVEARVADAARPVRVVVIDATSIGDLSMTVLAAMRDSDRALAERGVTMWVSAMPERALARAHRAPAWAEWTAAGRLWPTVDDAVAAYRTRTRSSGRTEA